MGRVILYCCSDTPWVRSSVKSVSLRTKAPLAGNGQILRAAECPLSFHWLQEVVRALGTLQAKANSLNYRSPEKQFDFQ